MESEFTQGFGKEKNREGNTYMRVTLESKMKLNEMKWKGSGALTE